MVNGFRRSISLPGGNPSVPPDSKVFPQPTKTAPVRSASLPCRAHCPAAAKLDAELNAAAAWRPSGEDIPSGLVHLFRLHVALADLLSLPHTRDSIRHGGADRLLGDLLVFADTLGSFRLTLVALGEVKVAAMTALRRRPDADCLSAPAQALRRFEKDLVAEAAALEKAQPRAVLAGSETAAMVKESRGALAVVYRGLAAAVGLAAALVGRKSSSWRDQGRKKLPPKGVGADGNDAAVVAALAAVGVWLTALEGPAEKAFRSVVNARVAVLNILSRA